MADHGLHRRIQLSAADVMGFMFRRNLGVHEQTFALGESLAHLHRLWHLGEVQRSRDAKGVYRFFYTP
ncbi:MAG: hypothetical protein QM740_10805 [Acidovorax sp.]